MPGRPPASLGADEKFGGPAPHRVLGDHFEGYSSGAGWQDAKLGLAHHSAWKRTAIVSDIEWVRHFASGLGWMVPGDFKLFGLSEREAAGRWVATDAAEG